MSQLTPSPFSTPYKDTMNKIIQELKTELNQGRGIRHNVLWKHVTNSNKNTSFIFCLNELIQKRIVLSFAPYVMLNPCYYKRDAQSIYDLATKGTGTLAGGDSPRDRPGAG